MSSLEIDQFLKTRFIQDFELIPQRDLFIKLENKILVWKQ